jgi:hypothetical protein
MIGVESSTADQARDGSGDMGSGEKDLVTLTMLVADAIRADQAPPDKKGPASAR